MKSMLMGLVVLCALVCWYGNAQAYQVTYDFETTWTGDYAPGWENSAYRWGEAPVAQMMQQTDIAYAGNYGMKLVAASVPSDSYWWAIVDVIDVNYTAMQTQYNPYISVMYYDDQALNVAGQLYAVPSYVTGDSDWTDTQFGSRFNQPITGDYYYVAASDPYLGWQDSGVGRTEGWHELKMQLLASDGLIHFFIDGTEVGTSSRNDYIDLGGPSLATMFLNPLSAWGDDKPYTIWDNYTFGSDYAVPEPVSIIAIISGLAGLVAVRRLRK